MKIVINRCFGGFGISNATLLELIERGSKNVEVMDATHYFGNRQPSAYELKRLAERVPFGDGYLADSFLEGLLYKDDKVYSSDRGGGIRTDPILIEIVERLGHAAGSKMSKLEVVEIPNGVSWEIDEYDGMETVEEVHRKWS